MRKFLDLLSSFPLSDVATFDCRNLSCFSLEQHQAVLLCQTELSLTNWTSTEHTRMAEKKEEDVTIVKEVGIDIHIFPCHK